MEKEEQERVRAAVEELLAVADMSQVTERKVRNLAAEKTGINLSQNRQWKGFVSNVITKYFESINFEAVTKRSASDAEAGDLKLSPEEEKPTSRDSISKKKKTTEEMEDIEKKEDISDEENEDDEEDMRGGGKRAKYETDEEGNHIICELSAKRKVVVSQWKGKTLVSMREYYEKDGKVLPTSKGISLTAEQFEAFAKASNEIDSAISSLQ